MNVAIYARVSTTDQNAAMQLDALRAYAKRNHLNVYKEYVDTGISGKTDKRKQLQNLMKDARLRHFDVVIVWKIDRFARSVKHFHTLIGELENKNIGFTSITQNIDTTSPTGKLMLSILAAFAEFETDIREERQKAGIAKAKSEGKHLGRPAKLNYWDIEFYRKQNYSYQKIADTLKVSKSAVIKCFKKGEKGHPPKNRNLGPENKGFSGIISKGEKGLPYSPV